MNLQLNNRRKNRKEHREEKGFTLIELLITIAIIGILAAIAYPSYQESVRKTHREEAKRTLLEAAQHMETYYAMNLTYTGAISAGVITSFTPSSAFSDDYKLRFPANKNTASTFFLKAIPRGARMQASDSCGVLSIDNFSITEAKLNSVLVSGCW